MNIYRFNSFDHFGIGDDLRLLGDGQLTTIHSVVQNIIYEMYSMRLQRDVANSRCLNDH